MADTPALRLEDLDTPSSIKSDRTTLQARLEEAARVQSTLHCVYFGGSKGVEQRLVPLKIDPPDVWALDVETGRRKRFRLGLLYILAPGEDPRWARPLEERTAAPKLLPKQVDPRNVRTLSQIIEDHGEALDALGWSIMLLDRAITLRRITDEEGEAVVALRQLSNGHWAVESLDRKRVSYRRIGAAAKVFLAAAERNARSSEVGPSRSRSRSGVWTVLSYLGIAVLALVLGLSIGVLLPH